jgi:hypothetical protein
MRITIELSEEQISGLAAYFKAAFGMWKDRGIDGVDYQRQLRAEDRLPK